MGGARIRICAALLIVFVAISAQCVASCSVEMALAAAQPPCHKSPVKAPETSCSHDQAAGVDTKVFKVELLAAIAIVPAPGQLLPEEPSGTLVCPPAPPPQSLELVSSTVLRI